MSAVRESGPATTGPLPSSETFRRPDWFTKRIFNPFVAWCVRRGFGMWGARQLEVRGRTSGEVRTAPVNLLTVDGVDHLVAPRGETNWVRNVRADDGRLQLRKGRSVTNHVAVEVADVDKPAILRPYLQRWKWEVGQFFDGVGPDATDEELLAIAHRHPVFRILTLD